MLDINSIIINGYTEPIRMTLLPLGKSSESFRLPSYGFKTHSKQHTPFTVVKHTPTAEKNTVKQER